MLKFFKTILAISLVGLVLSAQAQEGVWRAYDGRTGLTCQYYNWGFLAAWNNKGSDWLDATGTAQGNAQFSQVSVSTGQLGEVVLDVSAMLAQGLYGVTVRPAAGSKIININTRESTTPPRLEVTLANGMPVTFLPIADTQIAYNPSTGVCQAAPTSGPVASFGYGAIFVFDNVPKDARSAKLVLTINKAFGAGKLNAFRTVVPVWQEEPQTTGVAAQYTNDEGLHRDPLVWWFEDFDRPERWKLLNFPSLPACKLVPCYAWYEAAKSYEPNFGTASSRSDKGFVFAAGTGSASTRFANGTDDAGMGFMGNGLRVQQTRTVTAGGWVPTGETRRLAGKELDELYVRYMIKFGAGFVDSTNCDGGKLPGIAGNTEISGNGGRPANGLNGWSLRGSYHLVCDHANPAWGYILPFVYAYHGDMKGLNGDIWNHKALIPREQWACVEQYVKMNTPGQRDGVVTTWLNGRRTQHRTNVYLRGIKPAQGYGHWLRLDDPIFTEEKTPPANPIIHTDERGKRWWLGDRGLLSLNVSFGIERFWGTIHHGGKTPFGQDNAFIWVDNMVAAKERIGCVNTSSTTALFPPSNLRIFR